MYTTRNYRTAKEVREAFARGEKITVYHPGIEGSMTGAKCIEGPHYPEPHRWYLSVEIVDGVITKIKR